MVPRMKSQKPRRERRLERKQSDLECATSRGSVVSLVLLVGIIFCLVNVAIILVHVDTQQQEVPTTQGVASESTLDSALNVNRILPATKSASEYSIPGKNDEDLAADKEPILKILREAGFNEIDDETMRDLPTWTEVSRLYGDRPRIYGLDQCQVFQNQSDPGDHLLGTAGTFNSGTNLMAELLIHNCEMTARMEKYGFVNKGIRWQVPWGKHNPPLDEEFRLNHKAGKDADVDASNIMPAVTIRDPYKWMQSMCRIHYKAHWPHSREEGAHCPNLVPDERDRAEFLELRDADTVPVQVNYPEFNRNHQSLAHFWSEWYNEYVQAPFPRVIVRFEDLIFHAKEVTETVCKCAGGSLKKGNFRYIVDSAKKGVGAHGKVRTGFVDAIIRYGNDEGRLSGFTQEDLELARNTLDRDLMEFFGYLNPPLSTE